MIKKLYAIFDKKSGQFGMIFEETNDLVALRNFEQLVNDDNPNSLIKKYPEDYELYSLGTRDIETGEIKSEKTKIGDAKAYVKVQN